jgi:hypothetical protein
VVSRRRRARLAARLLTLLLLLLLLLVDLGYLCHGAQQGVDVILAGGGPESEHRGRAVHHKQHALGQHGHLLQRAAPVLGSWRQLLLHGDSSLG